MVKKFSRFGDFAPIRVMRALFATSTNLTRSLGPPPPTLYGCPPGGRDRGSSPPGQNILRRPPGISRSLNGTQR